MPVVIVEMWHGRTEEQKEKLIEGITKAFADISVPSEHLHIIIHDVPKCNWGTRGKPATKMKPQKVQDCELIASGSKLGLQVTGSRDYDIL